MLSYMYSPDFKISKEFKKSIPDLKTVGDPWVMHRQLLKQGLDWKWSKLFCVFL